MPGSNGELGSAITFDGAVGLHSAGRSRGKRPAPTRRIDRPGWHEHFGQPASTDRSAVHSQHRRVTEGWCEPPEHVRLLAFPLTTGLMKIASSALLSVLAAALLPCLTFGQSSSVVSEPRELSMGFQEAAPPAPGTFQLAFVGYHDTRCPSDVQCAVAGEARAFFWLTGENIRPQVVVLPWSSGEQSWKHAARAGRLEIRLLSLEPRPMHSRPVAPTEYKAVIEVRPRQTSKVSTAR